MALGLFIHSHQPVGNYDWVFEQNWDLAYRPMLEALTLHPSIRLTLHYSGPLIDWLTIHRPEFDSMVGTLVERGQVEIAGGGYYEPILAMLPEADRVGQVQYMSEEIERRWGVRPTGAWLAERVWEPGLVNALVKAGVRYTLVDDSHFAGTGLGEDELDGHYLTEDGGDPLAIVAGVQALRAGIPWKPVDDVITWFRMRTRASGNRMFAMGDDGEKFGSWPETQHYAWEDDGGWVERFFSALERNSDWLSTVQLGEWVAEEPPRGVIYLPTGSYQEMEEWALPPARINERKAYRETVSAAGIDAVPLRAGYWRNFLVKYPEVGAMRQRALRARRLIDQMQMSPARSEAEHALWAGECNCPYWHGIFGGAYLRHIRVATSRHLVRSERLARVGTPLPREPESADIDIDGLPELVIRTTTQQLVLDPSDGGLLREWDILEHDWPVLNVIARRPESYHHDLGRADVSISPGAHGETIAPTSLIYDRIPRLGLQERILRTGTTAAEWERNEGELAAPHSGPWETLHVGTSDGSMGVAFRREDYGLWIRKTVTTAPESARLKITYQIENPGRYPIEVLFASEWNLGLPGLDGSPGWEQIRPPYDDDAGPTLLDAGGSFGMNITKQGFSEMWEQRINTVTSSEKGIELSYQGLCLAFTMPVKLNPSEATTASLRWDVVTER